jgi:hypothetical protein
MSDERPPVSVITEADLDPAHFEMWAGKRRVRQGFSLPATPWDLRHRQWMCAGVVAGPADAEAAMTALVRGVGLVIAVQLSGDRRRRFLEDLSRVGSPVDEPTGLGPIHVALLESLADGRSLIEAATAAHVSRRTASRRMSEARVHYGVRTTAEAVLRWLAAENSRGTVGQADGGSERES